MQAYLQFWIFKKEYKLVFIYLVSHTIDIQVAPVMYHLAHGTAAAQYRPDESQC